MTGKTRKPAAPAPRIGGFADLVAGDPNEIKDDLARDPHPQGAGGVDIAKDATTKEKQRTKRRLKRVIW